MNDSFEQQAPLSSTATGTTLAATLEPNEPNPAGIGSGSAWWSHIPAAAGWVEFSTAGSAVDTVLLVFTGTGLNALNYRGGNDDASANETNSRLVMPVSVGQAYHLAVHHKGSGGDVMLSVSPWIEPEPRVSAMTPAATTVNVSTGAQSLAFTLGIDAWDAFSSGRIGFTGRRIASTFTPLLDLTGGDTLFGTYQTNVNFPRGLPPGDYWLEMSLTRLSGGMAALGFTDGEGQAFPAAAPVKITVVNTGAVDTTAPLLTALTTTPASVRVGTQDQRVESVAQVTDDFTGVHSGRLSWVHRASGWRAAGNGAALAEGTRASIAVRRDWPAGVYDAEITLSDVAANTRTLRNGTASWPAGVGGGTLTVTTAGNPFALWLAQNVSGPLNAAGDDPDSDGIGNLAEFALNLNPSMPDRAGLYALRIERIGAVTQLKYLRRRDGAAQGLIWQVETTANVATGPWQASTAEAATVDAGGGREEVTVPLSGNGRQFARVRITAGTP